MSNMGEPIKAGYRIITATATDMGIFTGKETSRLDLSALDHTNKFAIAIKEMNQPGEDLGDRWIELKLGHDKVVAGNVSSIAKRFKIQPDEVRSLAKNHKLEKTINKKIRDYEKDIEIVNKLMSDIENNKDNFDELKKILSLSDDLELSLDERQPLNVGLINDHKIMKLCKDLAQTCRNFAVRGSNGNKDTYVEKIQNAITHCKTELSKLDDNYVSGFKDKITGGETIWGNTKLIFNKAMPYGLSVGKMSPRMKVFDDDTIDSKNKFAIKTDGFIYHERPKSTDKFVPFSRDGKTWVMLNIQSLSNRLYLDRNKIIASSNGDSDGKILLKLINDQKNQIAAAQAKYLSLSLDIEKGQLYSFADVKQFLSDLKNTSSPDKDFNLILNKISVEIDSNYKIKVPRYLKEFAEKNFWFNVPAVKKVVSQEDKDRILIRDKFGIIYEHFKSGKKQGDSIEIRNENGNYEIEYNQFLKELKTGIRTNNIAEAADVLKSYLTMKLAISKTEDEKEMETARLKFLDRFNNDHLLGK